MADWQKINYFKNSLGNYGFYNEDRKKNNNQDLGYFSNTQPNNMIGDIAELGKQGYDLYNIFSNGASTMNPWVALGASALRSGQSALGGGSFKDDIPQAFFGINNSNDSEIMQGLKGAGSGAMLGAPFGPIGMAVGAALGLGSSFLDDI